MDDYGFEIDHDDEHYTHEPMSLLWSILYFYNIISDQDGCMNVFCAHFCDPKDNVL